MARLKQAQLPLDDEDCEHILKMLEFSYDENVPEQPVASFIFHAQHYFVAVFDYQVKGIHVYRRFWDVDRHLYGEEEGDPWHGNVMYENIAKLFRWDETQHQPREMLSWKQIGSNLMQGFLQKLTHFCRMATIVVQYPSVFCWP